MGGLGRLLIRYTKDLHRIIHRIYIYVYINGVLLLIFWSKGGGKSGQLPASPRTTIFCFLKLLLVFPSLVTGGLLGAGGSFRGHLATQSESNKGKMFTPTQKAVLGYKWSA